MPRSATVRVLHSLLVFSSCRWYQNKSSHFFLLCQHFLMLNCSRPNVHRFQSSDAGGGILCGARSNHGGLQVFVINYHSLTFILKAFIIFIPFIIFRMREMFKPSMAELGLCMYQVEKYHQNIQISSKHPNITKTSKYHQNIQISSSLASSWTPWSKSTFLTSTSISNLK